MTRLQFTYPGMGRNAGYLRRHIAAGNCTSSGCIVQVPVSDYRQKWNLDLPQYQIHCRYLLIDTLIGYRSNFRKTSFLTVVVAP